MDVLYRCMYILYTYTYTRNRFSLTKFHSFSFFSLQLGIRKKCIRSMMRYISTFMCVRACIRVSLQNISRERLDQFLPDKAYSHRF